MSEPRLKLYLSPGACSLASHIALCESGLTFDTEQVDFATGLTTSGEDFNAINPKGYVPALRLRDQYVLTENAAILQFIADLVPAKELAPPVGSFLRVRLQEWLCYLGTEVHKSFGPFFLPNCPDSMQEVFRQRLEKYFAYLERTLQANDWLMGNHYSVADVYLFTILSWCGPKTATIDAFPALLAYQKKIAKRPAVQVALQSEHLQHHMT